MEVVDNEKVDKFIDDLGSVSPDKLKIVEALRKIFHGANSNLTEDIKYGGLVFSLANVLVGGIYPYKDHISIEFSNGAKFSDPSAILEGKGKKRRHLKIYEMQNIAEKDVKYYVSESVE